jgi:hypothetical protein
VATKIQLRRGTASEWTAANPTLSAGELGFEVDTGKFKIGNNSSVWASLDYFLDSSDLSSAYLTQTSASSTYLSQASASTIYLPKTLVINTVASASYTLVLADAAEIVEMNFATANTLTVPPNDSVAFPIGTTIDITQYGAGQTTIAAGDGVTIRSANSETKLTSQYSGATIYKRGTNEWMLFGDLSA